jgi:thioredoxin-like negative regulator of GroEL
VKAPTDPADSAIHTVTQSTFRQRVLDSQAPVAVEFMSYGCTHCRTIEPLLQQAAREIEAQEQVFRVNVAVQPDLAAEYGVEGTPTLIMFRAGREVGRAEGPSPTLSSVMAALTAPFAR